MMDGVIIVDKPVGMTSAEVVRIVKRHLGCKTGHLGTLDPFASGVLPLCLGEGTKIAQFLNTADKEYAGLIRLGSETDTGDPTGAVTATGRVPQVNPATLSRVAEGLRGESLQIPPMYSAIKRHGMPLYKLARQGLSVERQPRAVRIVALELTDAGDGTVAFSVTCSKGTYVRVLAQQIAAGLGSLGHLVALRRTRFGAFGLAQAVKLDEWGRGPLPLIGLREALPHLREIFVDTATEHRTRQGYEPALMGLAAGRLDEAAKLIGPAGELAAIVVMDQSGRWRFARVINRGERAVADVGDLPS
jgi:tRNA pseudouridine55 synthase